MGYHDTSNDIHCVIHWWPQEGKHTDITQVFCLLFIVTDSVLAGLSFLSWRFQPSVFTVRSVLTHYWYIDWFHQLPINIYCKLEMAWRNDQISWCWGNQWICPSASQLAIDSTCSPFGLDFVLLAYLGFLHAMAVKANPVTNLLKIVNEKVRTHLVPLWSQHHSPAGQGSKGNHWVYIYILSRNHCV